MKTRESNRSSHQTLGKKVSFPKCGIIPLQPSHLVEASFGNVNVAVAHLHVDPQALHH